MQRTTITIHVFDLIGSPYCVSSKDGQRLFDKIVSLVDDGKIVHLSFEGVDIIISAFLNTAVGQLFGRFPSEQIDHQLSWSGLISYDNELIKNVINNAKMFFAKNKSDDSGWEEDIDDESEDE